MLDGPEVKPMSRSHKAETDANETPIVEAQGLTKHFSDEGGLFSGFKLKREGLLPKITYDPELIRAVEDVSFEIRPGETLGLVGESGCGKSTLARTLIRLLEPTDGDIYFKGENLAEMDSETLRQKRSDIQMIFQDPQSSLDPRIKVGQIIEEPMQAHSMLDADRREQRAKELLERVGLDPRHYNRYPHEFSGGQRQRVNLARALSVNPDLVVCDEPVSALDVSIQAQVLNTMKNLQSEFNLTFLFISHDLSVIRHISDRIAVMYLGHIVEVADTDELYENTKHPYTRALLDSIPVPDPRSTDVRATLEGDVPSPINPPSGCRFRTRCPRLIAPGEFEFSEEEWENVRRFSRAVKRRTFTSTDAGEIKNEFFEGQLPTGDPEPILEKAIELIGDGEFEQASTVLTENFEETSICAKEIPAYEVTSEYGTERHVVNCHIYRED
jgi:peptide/nickel transport system ATP-binding protein